MAKNVIAHMPIAYTPGGLRGLRVPDGYALEFERAEARLDAAAGSGPILINMELSEIRDKRTIEQNRLMWMLLDRMASAQAGGGGTASPWGCYLDMLAEFGQKHDIIKAPVSSLDTLRRAYRVVEMLELLDDNQCIVRCGMGSSTFSTAEMHYFIERIFDRLADMGVDDATTTKMYRDWRGYNNAMP